MPTQTSPSFAILFTKMIQISLRATSPLIVCAPRIDVITSQLGMNWRKNSEPNGCISILTDLCLDVVCFCDLVWGEAYWRGLFVKVCTRGGGAVMQCISIGMCPYCRLPLMIRNSAKYFVYFYTHHQPVWLYTWTYSLKLLHICVLKLQKPLDKFLLS